MSAEFLQFFRLYMDGDDTGFFQTQYLGLLKALFQSVAQYLNTNLFLFIVRTELRKHFLVLLKESSMFIFHTSRGGQLCGFEPSVRNWFVQKFDFIRLEFDCFKLAQFVQNIERVTNRKVEIRDRARPAWPNPAPTAYTGMRVCSHANDLLCTVAPLSVLSSPTTTDCSFNHTNILYIFSI